MAADSTLSIQKEEIETQIAHLTNEAGAYLIIIFLFALIQYFRLGLVNDYLYLMGGSILSFVGIIFYGAEITLDTEGKLHRSFIKAFIEHIGVYLAFFAFLFLCYLVFVRGIWELSNLVDGFEITILVRTLFFTIIGYKAILRLYKITEIQRMVVQKEINVKNE